MSVNPHQPEKPPRDIGEWIGRRYRALGRTQQEVAEDVGVAASTMRNWENADKLPPSRSNRSNLARSLNVTLRELEILEKSIPAGKYREPPLRTEVNGEAAGAYARAMPEPFHRHSLRWAPAINQVSAGPMAEWTDQAYLAGSAMGYIPLPEDAIPDPDLFYVRIRGDSMFPYFREGDWVLCSPAEGKRFTAGGLYHVQMNRTGQPDNCVRFVMNLGGDRLELRPANPRFPIQQIDGASAGLSAVVAVARTAEQLLKSP